MRLLMPWHDPVIEARIDRRVERRVRHAERALREVRRLEQLAREQ